MLVLHSVTHHGPLLFFYFGACLVQIELRVNNDDKCTNENIHIQQCNWKITKSKFLIYCFRRNE